MHLHACFPSAVDTYFALLEVWSKHKHFPFTPNMCRFAQLYNWLEAVQPCSTEILPKWNVWLTETSNTKLINLRWRLCWVQYIIPLWLSTRLLSFGLLCCMIL